MNWQEWIDDGLIKPDEEQRVCAPETITAAWSVAQAARAEYHLGNLEQADELLRKAFLTATRALLQSEGYTPCADCTFELARAAGESYFGPTIAKDLFSCVDDIDATAEHDDHAVKRGVVASATYTAVVGSRLALE